MPADHSATATFAIDQFTIAASSGAGGSVTPAGDTTVDYGLMTATAFVAAPADNAVIRELPWGGGNAVTYDTLAAWTAAGPDWADATGSLVARAHAILLFNATENARDVAVPAGTWTLPDGTAVGAFVAIAPFRSVVLVPDTAPPSTPPYVAASGIDWRADTPTTSVLSPDPEIAVYRAGTPVAQGGTDAVTGSAPGVASTSPTPSPTREGPTSRSLPPPRSRYSRTARPR